MSARKFTGAVMVAGTSAGCPDIAYVSGLSVSDPVVALRRGREVWLVVPQMELARARRCTGSAALAGYTVLTPSMLGLKRDATGDRLTRWAVALAERAGAREVGVGTEFPHGVARGLERRGIRVRLIERAAFPERAVKQPDEVTKIRECQQAGVIAMRVAIATIAGAGVGPGGRLRLGGEWLTSERVREGIHEVLFAQRCLCRDVIVACGRDAADPHEAGKGPLVAGETIVIDIFPQHLEHGYWGDLTRTVVKGRATPRVKAMYHAVRAAQAAALAAIRTGVRCATVHRAAATEIRRRGFETRMDGEEAVGFIHGTGHGVGLAIHEAPSLTAAPGRLRAGHVVTVEPGLYDPKAGGVRIEDTVVVTKTGWRYLAPCEKRLEV